MRTATIFLGALVFLSGISAFAENRSVEMSLAHIPTFPETPLRVDKDKEGRISGLMVEQAETLLQKARDQGVVPVIVQLKTAFQPEGGLQPNRATQQRNSIAAVQSRTITDLGHSTVLDPTAIKRFATIPYLALEVDAAGLQRLISSKDVVSIAEDGKSVPTLADTMPQIGANFAHSTGATGSGKVIAVLDTGVDKNHSFLSGKVVSEACYSRPPSGSGGIAYCPGGSNASTAVNSALPCQFSGCDHGTHVAGIAAGKGASFSGVAKDAKLIAIQVFYRNTVSNLNFSTDSDQILALERVYALRNTFSIAAVNMSLGTLTVVSSARDSDARKAVMDNLKSVRIATVISSGNNGMPPNFTQGSTTGVSRPGCISTAVTVGAVNKSDVVPGYSNSASLIDLLGPGGDSTGLVRSSIPGNLFGFKSGTSMAAPHVAGAFAIFRAKYSSASAADIEGHLESTGVSITDARNGLAKPRINVQQGLIQPNAPATLTIEFVGVCTGKNDISWSQPTIGSNLTYQAQWSTSSSFAGAFPFYNGTAAETSITVAENTYIRVRACSSGTCGVWKNSNPQIARPGENCHL